MNFIEKYIHFPLNRIKKGENEPKNTYQMLNRLTVFFFVFSLKSFFKRPDKSPSPLLFCRNPTSVASFFAFEHWKRGS